jgi:hypothetical protein
MLLNLICTQVFVIEGALIALVVFNTLNRESDKTSWLYFFLTLGSFGLNCFKQFSILEPITLIATCLMILMRLEVSIALD